MSSKRRNVIANYLMVFLSEKPLKDTVQKNEVFFIILILWSTSYSLRNQLSSSQDQLPATNLLLPLDNTKTKTTIKLLNLISRSKLNESYRLLV